MRRRMTDRLNLDVQEGLSGIRADAYLAQELHEFSRSALQKLIEQGAVLRNGFPCKKNDKL